jgi:hypothetical protein
MEAMTGLPDDIRLEVYESIIVYATTGNVKGLKPMANVAFNFAKTTIDRDADRYMSVVERNKLNGANGGRPKKEVNDQKPKKPSGLFGNPKNPDEPKKPDMICNDNDMGTTIPDGIDSTDLPGGKSAVRVYDTTQPTNKPRARGARVEQVSAPAPAWRTDFEIYKSELREVYLSLKDDRAFIADQRRYHPGVDVALTLEKACVNFWATEAGWKHKKRQKTNEIDWEATLTNAISQPQNKVYEPRNNSISASRASEKRNSLAELEREAVSYLLGDKG